MSSNIIVELPQDDFVELPQNNFLALLPFIVAAIITIIPALSICKRVGKTRWWAAVALIPLGGPVIFIWPFHD
jgi:uncharacterized membrane protein YhaH (DUF805 family)